MAKNLPTVSSSLPRDLQQFIQRVREALDGGGLDGLVTARQLVASGVASFTNGTVSTATGVAVSTPTPPTNLAGTGALGSVILTWDSATYTGHSYTEVWAATQTAAQVSASTAPTISQAVLVGMTAGNSFAHSIGSAATRYYWAKNVNRNGLASAFNATDGVVASTGSDPDYLMEVLTKEVGATSEAPFFQIDTATTINGVSIPAGTYIDTAKIADASITTAKIKDLAVDAAKIADATIVTAKINDAAITTAKVDAAAITTAKIADANITTAKIADANITTAKIGDAQITTAKIGDAQITNAKVANVIQSANYSSGSAGWKINKAGEMEMNNATFRGSLDVKSSASGERTVVTNSGVKVFDSSNVVRVKLGDLS